MRLAIDFMRRRAFMADLRAAAVYGGHLKPAW
jgi:hypothetical protein